MAALGTVPLAAIAEAVERVGGDLDDVRDLAETWRRLHVERGCRCESGCEPSSEGDWCYCRLRELGRDRWATEAER